MERRACACARTRAWTRAHGKDATAGRYQWNAIQVPAADLLRRYAAIIEELASSKACQRP